MTKKLFILRPKGYNTSFEEGAWDPWYDKAFGYVICAESELEARTIASSDTQYDETLAAAWLDKKQSTCKELVAGRSTGIIMKDFAAA